jgi:hypothetical protein
MTTTVPRLEFIEFYREGSQSERLPLTLKATSEYGYYKYMSRSKLPKQLFKTSQRVFATNTIVGTNIKIENAYLGFDSTNNVPTLGMLPTNLIDQGITVYSWVVLFNTSFEGSYIYFPQLYFDSSTQLSTLPCAFVVMNPTNGSISYHGTTKDNHTVGPDRIEITNDIILIGLTTPSATFGVTYSENSPHHSRANRYNRVYVSVPEQHYFFANFDNANSHLKQQCLKKEKIEAQRLLDHNANLAQQMLDNM